MLGPKDVSYDQQISKVVRTKATENRNLCATFCNWQLFLTDPGIPGVRSMGPSVCPSLTESCLVDLADMSLVYEDANSILSHDTIRAIPGNLDM